ncbi:MAG TPA: hypothetical protein VHU87_07635 [Rhizomicrobium sp.]|jgi:hypothetical protein|nr:hypothetical protein [Rhizomicrobium sp.]
MKTPATVSLADLTESADKAAEKADQQALQAGIKVAGLEKKQEGARDQTQKNKRRA